MKKKLHISNILLLAIPTIVIIYITIYRHNFQTLLKDNKDYIAAFDRESDSLVNTIYFNDVENLNLNSFLSQELQPKYIIKQGNENIMKLYGINTSYLKGVKIIFDNNTLKFGKYVWPYLRWFQIENSNKVNVVSQNARVEITTRSLKHIFINNIDDVVFDNINTDSLDIKIYDSNISGSIQSQYLSISGDRINVTMKDNVTNVTMLNLDSHNDIYIGSVNDTLRLVKTGTINTKLENQPHNISFEALRPDLQKRNVFIKQENSKYEPYDIN